MRGDGPGILRGSGPVMVYPARVNDAEEALAERRPATLLDVARRAGVSQPTASRVLNGSDRKVAEAYRVSVLQAAEELGYTANRSAQAVARGRSHTIALVISGISDPYFSAMADTVMKEAERFGLRVSIAVTDRRPDRELELVRELRGQRPRAIVLAGTGYVHPPSGDALVDELHRYERSGGRVVLVSRTDLPFQTVGFDDGESARQLGRLLADRGYRRCLVIGSGTPLLGMQRRVGGFLEGLSSDAAGEPVEIASVVRYTGFSWAGAHELVMSLDDATLAATDIVFAVTDDMALGALTALRARGLRVPDDIAVAGFDDITTLRDVVPSLTTVHVPLDEIARLAVAIAADDEPVVEIPLVKTVPILRESTPPR